MDSGQVKPDATPPWSGTSARPQRGDRRGLPPRPLPPPHAAIGRSGEDRSAVRAREEAEGAGSGDTGRGPRGVARREAAAGSTKVREKWVSYGAGKKSLRAPPEQPQPKRRPVRAESQAPPDQWKHLATPLGRNLYTDSSHRRVAFADGGPGAPEKAAPRRPLAGSKDGVMLGEAAGKSVLNKVPAAAGGARPMAGGSHHGADARMVKSSEASHRTIVPAGDGFPDTGSQGSIQDKNARKVHPVEPSIRHSSNEKTSGNRLQSGEKSPSWNLAKDVKVLNKSGGVSYNVAAKSSAQGPSKEHLNSKRVSEIGGMNRVSSHVPAKMSSQSTMMRNKSMCAPGKASKPANVIEESKVKEKETEHGGLVTTNGIVDTGKLTTDRVMDKRLIAHKSELATNRVSFGPKKKGKVKAPHHPLIKVVCAFCSKEKLDSKVVFNFKDDDVLKAAAFCEGELKLYIRNCSDCPSLRHQIQPGVQNADARSKFKMICRRFEFICRVLVQAVEQHSWNLQGGRIDIVADRAMKELPDFSKLGPVEGEVPGVKVGDEFLYRVQLGTVGLHRLCQSGIDWAKARNGTPIAVSIVCSEECYPDEMPGSGELIYIGSGGKLAGKKRHANQKLMRGNLALKNCIDTETPVRVIYGLKSGNVEGHSHSRAKKISTYTYDGLYRVVRFTEEGDPGSRMFKYMLKKNPEQPKLPLHKAERIRKSKMRRGLHMVDISEGKEDTPICVINKVDDVLPAPFEYITRIKSALCPTKVRPKGCGCTNGCSDSDSCSCARKNGCKFPFNFNGAIVSESPLIFECGPSCKCPPSCRNRVGQHGIKIPLEVFRTRKTGWGVRSLKSIYSGSFVCEYVGELRHSMEADQRKNSDYLFNIGHSKGFQRRVSGLDSSGTCSGTMDDVGFTIDATEYGNVGRFINHSCSPNLFAQNVLFDHGDESIPHIMFFAAETIPPLQELTCEYK